MQSFSILVALCLLTLYFAINPVSGDFLNFGTDANEMTRQITLIVPPQRTDFTTALSVPAFDAADGTLIEVRVSETVMLNGSAGYQNHAEVTSTIKLRLSARTVLQVDGSLLVCEPLINEVVTAPAGSSAILPPASVSADRSLSINDRTQLQHFVGNPGSFVTFVFTATGTSKASDNTGNVFVQFNTTAGAKIFVTYVFVPRVSNVVPAVLLQKTVLARIPERREDRNPKDDKKHPPLPPKKDDNHGKEKNNKHNDKNKHDDKQRGPPGSGPWGMPTIDTFALSPELADTPESSSDNNAPVPEPSTDSNAPQTPAAPEASAPPPSPTETTTPDSPAPALNPPPSQSDEPSEPSEPPQLSEPSEPSSEATPAADPDTDPDSSDSSSEADALGLPRHGPPFGGPPPDGGHGKDKGKGKEKEKDKHDNDKKDKKKHQELRCPGEKVLVIRRDDPNWIDGDLPHDMHGGIYGHDTRNKDHEDDYDDHEREREHEDPVLVTYCFRITNVGNTFLFPITLVDNTLGNRKRLLVDGGNPSLPLAPNDDITFVFKDFPIFKTTRNTATVIAQPSDEAGKPLSLAPVRDSDSALVIIKDAEKKEKEDKNDKGRGGPGHGGPIDSKKGGGGSKHDDW